MNLVYWILGGTMMVCGFVILSQAGKGGNPAMPSASRARMQHSHLLWGSGWILMGAGTLAKSWSSWSLALHIISLVLIVLALRSVLSARRISLDAGVPWQSRGGELARRASDSD